MIERSSTYKPDFLKDTLFRATVIDNVDPTNQGRIKVIIPRLQVNNRPDEEPIKVSASKKSNPSGKIVNASDNQFKPTVKEVNFIWARPVMLVNGISVEKTVTSNVKNEEPDEKEKTFKDVQINEDLKTTDYIPCSGSLRIPRIRSNVFVIFEDGDIKKCYYLPFGPSLKAEFINLEEVENKNNADKPNKRVNIDAIRVWQNGSIMYYDTNDDANVFCFRTQNGHRLKFEHNKNASGITLNTEKGAILRLIDKTEDESGENWNKFDNNQEDLVKGGQVLDLELPDGTKFLLDGNKGSGKIHIKTSSGHSFDLIDQSSKANGSFTEPYYDNNDAGQVGGSFIKLKTADGNSMIFFDKGSPPSAGKRTKDEVKEQMFDITPYEENEKEFKDNPEALEELMNDDSDEAKEKKSKVRMYVGIMVTPKKMTAQEKFPLMYAPLLDSLKAESIDLTDAIASNPDTLNTTLKCEYVSKNKNNNNEVIPYIAPIPTANTAEGVSAIKEFVINYLRTGVERTKNATTLSAMGNDNNYPTENDYKLNIHELIDIAGNDETESNLHETFIDDEMEEDETIRTARSIGQIPTALVSLIGGSIFFWRFDSLFKNTKSKGILDVALREMVKGTICKNVDLLIPNHSFHLKGMPMVDDNIVNANQVANMFYFTEVWCSERFALLHRLDEILPRIIPKWLEPLVDCKPKWCPAEACEACEKICGGKPPTEEECDEMDFSDDEAMADTMADLVLKADEIENAKENKEEGYPKQACHEGPLETTGKPFIRVTTKGNNYITISDSDDTIEVVNNSNAYIRMIKDEVIDVFTPGVVNITAGKDINLKAGGNINLNATKKIVETSGMGHDIITKDFTMTASNTATMTAMFGMTLTSRTFMQLSSLAYMSMIAKTNVTISALGALSATGGGTALLSSGGRTVVSGSQRAEVY